MREGAAEVGLAVRVLGVELVRVRTEERGRRRRKGVGRARRGAARKGAGARRRQPEAQKAPPLDSNPLQPPHSASASARNPRPPCRQLQ
eukprot:3545790-Rhodomonas_salina.1